MNAVKAWVASRPLFWLPWYWLNMTLEERLRRRMVVDDNDCWLWTGMRDYGGYGRIAVGSKRDGTNRSQGVHLAAYELWVGPIPDGLVVDHLCRVPNCFNPLHLEPVTHAENNRRRGASMETCRRGHPRTPEHTYRKKDGHLQCRTCQKEQRIALRATRTVGSGSSSGGVNNTPERQ